MDELALTDRIRSLGAFAQTLESNPRLSIRPEDTFASTRDGTSGVEDLGWRLPDAPLELRDTIGEGGMGIVHLGVQRSLDRKVAVKALRAERRTAESVEKLLSEAKITGRLEHPNVVPVHDIAIDEDGSPLIVLKRIEGVGWSQLLKEPRTLAERYDAADPLEWHLGVLMQVCRAVHFAHSRGVLHRDLKPENVMIGSFGEVYVLDWGLAVRLETSSTLDSQALPLATEAVQMAGTPSYMAPEMLGGEPPSRLGVHTDVYLLGAILYEILAGLPPHTGRRLIEILLSVAESKPTFPASAPAELAAIATKAMSKDPGDRFPSAEALRLAIADYLRHRGSIQLTEEAEARLGELASASAEPGQEARARALFAEAHFGFVHALKGWPDNARASKGRRRALEVMIEHELAREGARAASRLLEELADPPAELAARVAKALEAERADKDDLARLRRDLDPRFGHRTRIALTAALGVFWTLGPIASELTGMGYARSAASLAVPPAIVTVVVLALGWILRDVVRGSALNRQLLGTVVISTTAEACLHSGGALAGMTPAHTLGATLLLFGVAVAIVAIAHSRALLVASAAYLCGFFLVALFPEQRAYVHSGVNLVFTSTLLYAWVTAAKKETRG
jgi:tRNA A-37 threonylcarbamoyl transferase component Bud32